MESFHNALYESMSLAGKAVTAGRMLQRLGAAIGAELTAIESIERRADENRRIRYAVAVGFVSAVAIPASLILAYLGINASQVNPNRSMFDHRYLGMYLIVAAVIVLGVAISAGVYVQQRRAVTPRRAPGERPPLDSSPLTSRSRKRAYPIQPRRCAAAPAANLLVTSSRSHDGRDVPADRGDAEPGAAGDRVVMQAFGHQLQDRLLGGGQPTAGGCGLFGFQRGGPVPEHLEVLAQRGGDQRGPDHQRAGRAGRGERQHRGGLVGELHLHRHPRQQPGLLPRLRAGRDDPPRDRMLHRRGGVDGPAPHPAAEGGQRRLREIVGERHLGVQVLQASSSPCARRWPARPTAR